jgi:hypothetical protein
MLGVLPGCKFFQKKSDAPSGNPPTGASASFNINLASDQFYSIWKKPYELRINSLPTSGGVASGKIPYSGSGYAELEGGANVDGALTKYDKAFGTRSAAWEAKNHQRSRKTADDDWAGHCNGYSAAAIRHKEPFKSVKDPASGVTFTPQNIKALLAEVYMSAKSLFLGGNRCEKKKGFGTDPDNRPDPEKMGECEDVNPALFHLALANWLGFQKHAVVLDNTISNEIWNYPLYKYTCDNCTGGSWTTVSPADAQAIVGSPGSKYRFNAAAQKLIDVKLTITYSLPLDAEQIGANKPSPPKTYRYVLELNERGEIIGGEWAQANQNDHPDFIWVPMDPSPPTGEAKFSNPEIDYAKVMELWKLSIDDPNPEMGIEEPVWQSRWGKFENFSVTLDGSTGGAVFLGKKTKLVVKRLGGKFDGSDLQVLLNGEELENFKSSAEKDKGYETEFNSPVGFNTLSFKWSTAASDVFDVNYYGTP